MPSGPLHGRIATRVSQRLPPAKFRHKPLLILANRRRLFRQPNCGIIGPAADITRQQLRIQLGFLRALQFRHEPRRAIAAAATARLPCDVPWAAEACLTTRHCLWLRRHRMSATRHYPGRHRRPSLHTVNHRLARWRSRSVGIHVRWFRVTRRWPAPTIVIVDVALDVTEFYIVSLAVLGQQLDKQFLGGRSENDAGRGWIVPAARAVVRRGESATGELHFFLNPRPAFA